jgi:putative SOS response-associated peptidase YedK
MVGCGATSRGIKEDAAALSSGEMKTYPVSKAVGNVKNQGPELIDEVKIA